MTQRARRISVLAVALAAASVLLVTSGALVVDYAVELRQTSRDKERIEQLRIAGVQQEVAEGQLTAELDRITAASLERDRVQRFSSWIVLVSALVMLLAFKRYAALGAERLPGLEVAAAARAGRSTTHSLSAVPRRTRNRRTCVKSPITAPDNGIDLVAVDRIIERQGRSAEAAIAVIQEIQGHFRYLPDVALRHVCDVTEITPAQIAGVSSFYAQFRRSPVGKHIIKVCHGTACHVAGAGAISDELRRRLGIAAGADTDPRREFTVDQVACLGCCSLAPVMMVDDVTAGQLTPAAAASHLTAWREEDAA